MPLPTISEMATARLPIEAAADAIATNTTVAMYEVQKYTALADADVETEANYTNSQRIALSVYVAYLTLAAYLRNASATVSTNTSGSTTTTGEPFLSKAKVDVLEVEFDNAKKTSSSSGGASTARAQQAAGLLDQLRQEACAQARAVGWALPICAVLNAGEQWRPQPAPVGPLLVPNAEAFGEPPVSIPNTWY